MQSHERLTTHRPNKVPKFAEHKIAERRRNAKNGMVSVPKHASCSAFDAARKKYHEKQGRTEEDNLRRLEREKAVEERNKRRKQVGKLIRKKNDRGQPNMQSQLELLMQKFTKSINMPEPGRNPLLDHNDSLPGKKPESVGDKVSAGFTKTKSFVSDSAHKVATSETYGKVKVGAGVAWDKTKDVSVAAAHAAKPAAIATKNAAVGLFEKTKAAFSKK